MTKPRKIIFIALIILILLAIGLFFYIKGVVYPLITNLVDSTVEGMYSEAIARAATELKESEEFKLQFFNYEKDVNGDITAILSNSYNINQVNFLIQKIMNQELNALENANLIVNLGAFLGTTLTASYGPEISVYIMPIGAVQCKFCSVFADSGLNQTLHRIYIEITSSIALVLPLDNIVFEEKSEIILAENLIIGDIPETYLEGESTTDYLDLVP